MATMCENCFEVDSRKYKSRRTCKHCGGLLVQIDEMMLPTISLLNKKGYRTRFCCSGHVYDDFIHPFLLFQTYVIFEKNIMLPSIPNDFRYDGNYEDGRSCIRKDSYDGWTDSYAHCELLKGNLSLIEWATMLPPHNESNIL